jgi:ATP-binding cassette subfamily C (CFTR/MRP) protein 1
MQLFYLYSNNLVSLKNANFSWTKSSNWSLHNLNLNVKQGQLVGIVGRVGSGKTALMSALAGQLELLDADECRVVADRIAWVEQRPWIQNNTFRDSILFGAEFNSDFYWQCVKACALQTDLDLLADGDRTLIGHRVSLYLTLTNKITCIIA